LEKCEIFLKICRITSRVRQEKSALAEAELVEAVRMGLREGQTEMVCRYAERVFAMVVRQVTDVMDAQELTQDTFLRAFSRIDSYDPQKASLSTWLCRIAYRLTLDFLKRRSPAIVSMEESSVWHTDISDELLEAELSTGTEERIGLLEQVMDSLPDDEQMLLTLYYFEDHPLTEIAYITGVDAKVLANRLYRIRKKLYMKMKK
jgi:RNA polymerase sigma-70 factor (ECF subfamily)